MAISEIYLANAIASDITKAYLGGTLVYTRNLGVTPYVIRYWGQSNMDGNIDPGEAVSAISHLPQEYRGTFENVKIWDGTTCSSLDTTVNNNQFPVSERDTGFGPEITSLIDLANQTGAVVYAFKYAIENTNMAFWLGAGNADLRSEHQDFQAYLDANVPSYTEMGLVVSQGEADALVEAVADAWDTNFATLKAQFDTDAGATLDVHLIHVHEDGAWTYISNVRARQESYVAANTNAFGYVTDNYYLADSNVHLDSQGQIEVGFDLVNAWIGGYSTTDVSNDFYVKSGSSTTGGTLTLTNGVDYDLPVGVGASSVWFMINNVRGQSNGRANAGTTSQLNKLDVRITDISDPQTSIVITMGNAHANSRIDWQIIAYKGDEGGANEFIVRNAGVLSGVGATVLNSSVISGIENVADVAVLITAQSTAVASATLINEASYTGELVDSGGDVARFTRIGAAGSNTQYVSYAVIEFTGSNWTVNRQQFDTTGTVWADENKASFDVSLGVSIADRSKTFTITQVATDIATNQGVSWAAVGIKDVNTLKVYNRIVSGTNRKVVWIIENSSDDMQVQHLDQMWDAVNRAEQYQFTSHVNPVPTNGTALFMSSSANTGNPPTGFTGYVLQDTHNILYSKSESGGTFRILGTVVKLP